VDTDYSILFIEIDDSIFAGIGDRAEHISKPTFYRLMIPSLPIIGDKAIYLDGDTICCSDIIQLYNQDITEFCIAGCRQTRPPITDTSSEYIKNELKITDTKDYINAGVLLMNVRKIREMNIDLVAESLNNLSDQDQGVINKCFFGLTKIIHPRFNLYSWASNFVKYDIRSRYDKDIIAEAVDDPCIIHFACLYTKPWINAECVMGEKWWIIAKSSLTGEQLSVVKAQLSNNIEKYADVADKVDECSSIFIFGCGRDGKLLLNYSKEKGFYKKVIFICDNNESRFGEKIDGITICSPEILKTIGAKDLVVVSSRLYWKEMTEQILDLGVPAGQIMRYRPKDWEYKLSFCDVKDFDPSEVK